MSGEETTPPPVPTAHHQLINQGRDRKEKKNESPINHQQPLPAAHKRLETHKHRPHHQQQQRAGQRTERKLALPSSLCTQNVTVIDRTIKSINDISHHEVSCTSMDQSNQSMVPLNQSYQSTCRMHTPQQQCASVQVKKKIEKAFLSLEYSKRFHRPINQIN